VRTSLARGKSKDQNEDVKARYCIKDPAPRSILGDESTSDWSKGWAQERHEAVYCDGPTAVLAIKEVSKDATADLTCVRI